MAVSDVAGGRDTHDEALSRARDTSALASGSATAKARRQYRARAPTTTITRPGTTGSERAD